ncbi:transposase [Pedobacter kyungheensis]|uniref:Transposase n=1 Tax=Pedobacter kyungheensis TaxID=1069985 RepID=A0A0C1FHL2_9SPHI|nr:IS200/IS605 family transposase [Pedobacter kyungheensis]KIA91268.1 transposase [Pedobacter kyungheensis]
MSYVRIWVHLVFSTKNRHPYLTKNIRYKVHKHIMDNCKNKSIFLQSINGFTDHLHCLISLGKDQSISNVAQLIKGESSFWINQNKLTEIPFMWQGEYYAVSVSDSQLNSVINYIKNQEAHHSKKSFADEVKEFEDKYKFVIQKEI